MAIITEPASSEQKLSDPVCGMSVTKDSKHHYEFKDAEYYFCSSACEKKFIVEPEKYFQTENYHAANPLPVENFEVGTTYYSCPMHPEIRQKESGTCPKCGMTLEAINEPVAATHTEYTCPMHPEIIQDHPGNCPKCGMALEAITVATEEKNEELLDMTRRFKLSAILAIPVFILAMIADLAPSMLPNGLSMQAVQ